MRDLADLPQQQQDAIRGMVDAAPPLSDQQRERLALLLRGRPADRRAVVDKLIADMDDTP